MGNKSYQTVSCAMHSELELAIMHGNTLKISYLKPYQEGVEANEHVIEFRPYDVITRGQDKKGEFLVGQDKSGQTVEIRLDQICHFNIINR